MLRKFVSTGLLAASLMAMSGIVGASDVDNTQSNRYTTGFVKVKNSIRGDANGLYHDQLLAESNDIDVNANVQGAYGQNDVHSYNDIYGETNSLNKQINNYHSGTAAAKNKLKGDYNHDNKMISKGYNDSSVENGIYGYNNANNKQKVGWQVLDEYGHVIDRGGVSTKSKATNTIDSSYWDNGAYGGNSANVQKTKADSNVEIDNSIYGDGYLLDTYIPSGNQDNTQYVKKANTTTKSDNQILGIDNLLNMQKSKSQSNKYIENNIDGNQNLNNDQKMNSKTNVSGDNTIEGIFNAWNEQASKNKANEQVYNNISGYINDSNSQEAKVKTDVIGDNNISGFGNHENVQESKTKANTDVSNNIKGDQNSNNQQTSEANNHVHSSNSIQSWNGFGPLE